MCECISDLQTRLAEKGVRLKCAVTIDTGTGQLREVPRLDLEQPDGRKPTRKQLSVMWPTFCPFCGVRYVPADEAAA